MNFMKVLLAVIATGFVFTLASCQSGNTAARSDYSDKLFDPLAPRIQDRAKYLRSLDPRLSQAEAISKASADLRREKEAGKKRAAQKTFEADLAKSLP